MSKTGWMKWALVGGGASLLFAACTVGSGDGDIDKHDHGTGGDESTGSGGDGNTTSSGGDGTSTDGGSASTTTGGSGATGTGGGAGGEGPAPAELACESEESESTTSCTELDSDNPCELCIQENCCTQFEACLGEGPDQACAWGGPEGEGEFYCVQNCMLAFAEDSNYDEENLDICAGECLTESCDLPNVTDITSDMIGCGNNECFTECYDVEN
jgi:hypothetical protein